LGYEILLIHSNCSIDLSVIHSHAVYTTSKALVW